MSTFRSIEIDFEVHKCIEAERTSFAETPNDVLRRLLGVGSESPLASKRSTVTVEGRPWSGKGVILPHGTQLRMEYNGTTHTGRIEDGEWVINKARYRSPSAAAGGVGRTRSGGSPSLDGWIYWRARRPGDTAWIPIQVLREAAEAVSSE